MKPASLTLNAILIKDASDGKFTGYFKGMPEVIAEGSTEDETITNLTEALNIMFSVDEEEETSDSYIEGSVSVKERNVQYSLN